MEDKKQHGGRRSGAGRPAGERNLMLSVRISQEAFDKIAGVSNKSEFIDNLIKKELWYL